MPRRLRRPPLPTILHVYPRRDLQPHEFGETDTYCWCAPVVERPTASTILVIHHAADGRELVERYGVQ